MRTRLRHTRPRPDSHPGLLLHRYVAHPADGSPDWSKAKRAILQAAIDAARGNPLYQAAFAHWQESLPELTAANDLQTAGRLVIGLGSESVLETGLLLHHTYGLPMLPGSALKGLAAHYCDQVWGTKDPRFRKPTAAEAEEYRQFLADKGPPPQTDNFHRLLFGATEDGGCVVFHDAWLVPGPDTQPLRLDVMTPHHPGWLDGRVPPTDFDSPTPVPFLSVSGRFHVAVSWHGPADYGRSVAWTMEAFALLAAALADWGIGGKTTSGYGRLTEVGPRRLPFSPAALGLPAAGTEVHASLLDAPKKDKPWRARIELPGGKGLSGPIAGEPPAPPKPGETARVLVTQVGENSIRFQWPRAAGK